MLFVLSFQGALGTTVGVVVGSTAALAVAAGIFVFFVRKLRKRNSKNSNGKSSILKCLLWNTRKIAWYQATKKFVLFVASFKNKASLEISKQF